VEKKAKHLEMIQSVIERMGNNSFLIKGWNITLVSAIFVIAFQDKDKIIAFWTLFPAIIFWLLDGFYLWQERLLRCLYDHVRKLNEKKIDFSMDTSQVRDIKIRGRKNTWINAVLSRTLFPFHGGMVIAIAVVALIFTFF
jgi:signal transduction histidine kinase